LASNLFGYLFSDMAVHFSTLLAMPTSARSPINPLCRPPLTTHNWSPPTIACSPLLLLPLLHACYTHTTCSALLLQYTDCTLAQHLPLPAANSAACLTHPTTARLWLHHRSLTADAAAAVLKHCYTLTTSSAQILQSPESALSPTRPCARWVVLLFGSPAAAIPISSLY
jgi:hypothetical protein